MLNQGYGILPNLVLFDKNLSDKQKLLFCLISSLCAENGSCWASNDYLSEKLNCKSWAISKNLNSLIRNGFLEVQFNDFKRFIFIGGASEKSQGGLVKNHKGASEKSLYNNINKYYKDNIIIFKEKEEKNLIDIKETNQVDDIIYNLEQFRLFLNKGKLQEEFFYKIGDLDSFERLTADFYFYMEDKGKPLNKKTAEARFKSYLKPKWETKQDREDMIKSYERKKKKSIVIADEFAFSEEAKIKEKLINESFKNIDDSLSDDIKGQFRQEAEKQILELTKGRGVNLPSFGLMVQNRYKKIILDNEDIKSQYQKFGLIKWWI